MAEENGNVSNGNGNGARVAMGRVKLGLVQMLKGGVITSLPKALAVMSLLTAKFVCRRLALFFWWRTMLNSKSVGVLLRTMMCFPW